jgi:hypothetical protein
MHNHYLIHFRPRLLVLTHPAWLALCRIAELDGGQRLPWYQYRAWEMRTVWKANG